VVKARGLSEALSVLCLGAILAVTTATASAAGPSVKAPARVTPGAKTTVTVSGFPAHAALRVYLSPTENRLGNCCAADVAKRFQTNAHGRAVLRFRVPTRFRRCAGYSNCVHERWKEGSKVDVNVSARKGVVFAFGVSRIASRRQSGSKGGAHDYHRCGGFIFTPQSDDALFDVRSRGIGCHAVRRALQAWHDNGYQPRSGPTGYRCKVIGKTASGFRRTSCHRKHHRLPSISFSSGP
jgi:hypothetical protein